MGFIVKMFAKIFFYVLLLNYMNVVTTLQQQKFLVTPWVSDYKTTKQKKTTWDRKVQILRDEISNAWHGLDSVEEIKNQRNKTY